MIKWIRRLLGLCEHDWKDVGKTKIYEYPNRDLPVATELVQRCAHCAKYRKQQV